MLQQSTSQSLLCCQPQKAASGFWDSLGMSIEMHSAPNHFVQFTALVLCICLTTSDSHYIDQCEAKQHKHCL